MGESSRQTSKRRLRQNRGGCDTEAVVRRLPTMRCDTMRRSNSSTPHDTTACDAIIQDTETDGVGITSRYGQDERRTSGGLRNNTSTDSGTQRWEGITSCAEQVLPASAELLLAAHRANDTVTGTL